MINDLSLRCIHALLGFNILRFKNPSMKQIMKNYKKNNLKNG